MMTMLMAFSSSNPSKHFHSLDGSPSLPSPHSLTYNLQFQKAYNAHEVSKTFGGFTETYYHQLLDLVCLRYPVTQLERSSEACGKAWTNPKVLPPVGVCDLGKGGPFDKEVIGGLVEEVWEKVEERTGEMSFWCMNGMGC